MKVTVIGSGTMGNGIAHAFVQHGYATTLCDLSTTQLEVAVATVRRNLERQVDKGLLSKEQAEASAGRLHTTTQLQEAVCMADLVIEAVSENVKVKTELYQEIEKCCPEHSIIATNTSSISITKLAAATKRADRFIGMHFMNPVPVMKLVEVIKGYGTAETTCNKIIELTTSLNKQPIVVNDYPGFISNRILLPMINEAIWSLMQGVAGVEEIDGIMKLGMAHPMGPLQLADFIGLDVCLSILRVMQEGFGDPKYAPCPLLVNMVEAGHKGIKSGTGFYQYTKGSKEVQVAPMFR